MKELLLASEGFRRAYDVWSRAPEPEASWEKALLTEAEQRLDAARDHVNEVQVTLRGGPQ